MPPHLKNLLDPALPKDEGGSALFLREYHNTAPVHLVTLTEHARELACEHNVGAVGLEMPPYMMLFVWNLRDAPSGEKKSEAERLLRRAFTGYALSTDPQVAAAQDKTMQANAELTLQMQAEGINMMMYDTRYLLKEHAGRWRSVSALLRNKLPARQYEEHDWMLQQASRIYNTNPHYAKRLNAIEDAIRSMRAQGVPDDTISATILSEYVSRNKNVVVGGVHHADGTADNAAGNAGIVDDAFERQGWSVTDALVIDSATAQLLMRKFDPNDSVGKRPSASIGECQSYDRLDAIYITNADILDKNPRDFLSCTQSPKVEEVFKPWQLDPMLLPDVKRELEEMKKAMEDTYAHPKHGTGVSKSGSMVSHSKQ